jgi:hypothetical protein
MMSDENSILRRRHRRYLLLRFNPDDSDIDEIKIAWGADLRFLSARVSREIAVVLPLDRQAKPAHVAFKRSVLSETWRRAARSSRARHGQSHHEGRPVFRFSQLGPRRGRIRGLSPIQECSSKPPTRTRSCENFFHAPAVRFLSSAPHHRSRAARLDRSALRPTNVGRPF